MSARNRELFGLLPATLLVMAGFGAVFIQERDQVADASLTYGLVFLGLCLAAHLVIRARIPDADPYLFPIVAVLASVGLVVIYRIDDDAGPRAGAVVRRRARALHAHDPAAARLPRRWSATAT